MARPPEGEKKPPARQLAPAAMRVYREHAMSIDRLPTREGYDRWSGIYDEEDNPLIVMESDWLPGLLGEVRGLRIADVGCGTGRYAVPLALRGAEVTALDFSEAMMAKARAKPGAERVRFVHHDLAEPLPLPSASFDRVLSCLVLDHIFDLDGLFGEMARICRADGFVLASAMHPAMMLRGIQARFVDPETGNDTRPASAPNQISSYLMAAVRAGLGLDHLSEHIIDEVLAARSPRAHKHLGWPLLLLMRLRPRRAERSAPA
jgi:ubiquinone/menaquinone biosynthesis C-methylase UbiE